MEMLTKFCVARVYDAYHEVLDVQHGKDLKNLEQFIRYGWSGDEVARYFEIVDATGEQVVLESFDGNPIYWG